MKFDKMGWVVTAAIAGAMSVAAISGFQNTPPKFANIDIEKVFNESDLSASNSKLLDDARKLRAGTLQYLFENRVMNPADAQKYATLAIKSATPTGADKTEIDRIKAAAEDSTRKQRDLATKNPPTDADRQALQDYSAKAQQNQLFLQTLRGQYENDISDMANDLRDKTLVRVRSVIADLAGKQGYTVVFSTSAAPYAANDLTDAAPKILKK